MRQELTIPGTLTKKTIGLREFNHMIQESEQLHKCYPIYKTIVNSMERKYSWLGRQVAEELLDSVALSVIERTYNPPFRANQHVLLIWDVGWFKSSLLSDFKSFMPAAYFGGIGKVTDAVLRGTVETAAKPGYRFVAPKILDYDFLVVKEFGKNLTEETGLKETLLTALEDRVVEVSLAKFAQLDSIERKAAEEIYKSSKFRWDNATSFSYMTHVTLWCANYTPIEDNAMLSRFDIVVPEQELDVSLKNWVMTHPYLEWDDKGIEPFETIWESIDALMGTNRPILPVAFDLSDILSDVPYLTPRMHSNIIKKLLAAAWWGFWLDEDAVKGMALTHVMSKSKSMKGQEDVIMELLKSGFHTIGDISSQTGTSYSMVWKILNSLKDKPFLVVRQRDSKDRRKIYIKVVENPNALPIPEKRNLINMDVSDVELIASDKK
jgi:hypothetical protein